MVNQNLPVLFVSIEMSGKQIAQRLISGIGQIELRKVLSGKAQIEDCGKINTAAMILEKARNGSTGTVKLATDLARSTFADLSPEYYAMMQGESV